MTAKQILCDLVEKKNITLAALADRLSITPANLWARLHEQKVKNQDISVRKLVETAKALDYKVVVVPRESRVPEEGYVVE